MFDPYHKWLGIPKKYRPPTYYQLLGIDVAETDAEVIDEAAIRQTAHLRTYQSGPQANLCTRLLNEIAQARTTLLNPVKRKKYDALLAQKTAVKKIPKAAPMQPRLPQAVAASPFADLDAAAPSPSPRTYSRKNNTGLIIGLVVAGAVFVLLLWTAVGVVGYFLVRTLSPSSKSEDTSPPRPTPIARPPIKKKVDEPPPKPKPEEPPNPKIVLEPALGGANFDGFIVRVTNWADYPKEMFRMAPELGPINAARVASRTLVHIHSETGRRIGGELRMDDVARLQSLRLLVSKSMPRPKSIYVVLTDRQLNKTYKSEPVALAVPKEPPNNPAPGVKQIKTFREHRIRSSLDSLRLLPKSNKVFLGGTQLFLWQVGRTRILSNRRDGGIQATISISPDETRAAASYMREKDISIWDIANTRQIGTLKGHTGAVNRVVFLPDGKHLLSAGEDNTILLWDIEKQKIVQPFSGHAIRIYGLAVSPDGSRAVSCSSDGDIRLWDLAKRVLIRNVKIPSSLPRALTYSPDGKRIVAGVGNGIVIFDADLKTIVLRAHTDHAVRNVCVSPNGEFLVTCGFEPRARVWETGALQPLCDLVHTDNVADVVVASDNRTIYGCTRDRLCLWQLPAAE